MSKIYAGKADTITTPAARINKVVADDFNEIASDMEAAEAAIISNKVITDATQDDLDIAEAAIVVNEADITTLDQAVVNLASKGAGYWFDGANDVITVPDNANINFGENDFSAIIFISDIEDVNMAEAITRVNNDQTALEVSYKLTAELARLSLLNFI
jgi:flagellin-like hook-associated protein FlgL